MMKFALRLFGLSLTCIATPAMATSIISPVAADIWQIGNTYSVRWNTSAFEDKVSIALVNKDTNKVCDFDGIPNTGTYAFTVPATAGFGSCDEGSNVPGNHYQINVWTKAATLNSGLFSLVASSTSEAFNDVPASHPDADAIRYVQEHGYVNGYEDGTFRPDNKINRVEFTKIIVLYKFGQEMVDMCGSRFLFQDLSTTAWYVKYICRAKDAHIVEGYPDGTFRPDNQITFAEAAKIIASASSQSTSDPRLPEVAEGAPWYETYVRFLAEHNAIPLSVTSLTQRITRGEMAEIIYRLSAGITNKPSRTYEELVPGNSAQANWKTYTDEQLKFKINYPPEWQIWSVNVAAQCVSFGRPQRLGMQGYDGEWFLCAKDVASTSMDEFIQTMGDQFSDRVERREQIVLDGVAALKVTVTTPSYPDWVYTTVLVEGNGKIFTIHDGASPNALFNAFYQSFKFVADEELPQTILHRNTEEGWSMEYPRAWSMQEHMSVPSLDSLLPKETVGTLFQESASTNTHVFVARLATCPDLSERGNVEAGDNVVIGGRVFSHASLMDGAAGSVGEFHYYASAKDASHCTIIVSFYFHSTGEAYDEPQRSQVKRGIAEMQQVIERMVQSYRDL